MSDLSPSQRAAVESAADNILVLAGPGSGKTRVLVARIRRMIESGVAPDSIACMTFTNSAAAEIAARLDGVKLGHVGTLHSFSLRMLRDGAARFGLPSHLAVIDDETVSDLLATVAKEMHVKAGVTALKSVLKRDVRLSPDLELVRLRFNKRLVADGLLTYDMVLELLAGAADGIEAMTFEHLLVDEVQDSSPVDARIYTGLSFKTRFYVGDPDQSIYSFRGGSIDFIMGLAAGRAEMHKLTDNHRSGSCIAAAANSIIRRNTRRVEKNTMSVTDFDGHVEVLLNLPDAAFEGEQLAQRIKKLLPDESVGVLCRTNFLARQVADALERNGVTVTRRCQSELPADWGAAMKFMALLSNPENDFLAGEFIRHTQGQAAALKAKRDAMAAFLTINRHLLRLPLYMPPVEAPSALRRAGFSAAVADLVSTRLPDLMPGDRLVDLQALVMAAVNDVAEMGDGRVRVMTMHAAKGREFDAVFLPALEHDTIPNPKKDVDLEEERRLMFVAITRAKCYLCMSAARERVVGHWQRFPAPQAPSRFIFESDPFDKPVTDGELRAALAKVSFRETSSEKYKTCPHAYIIDGRSVDDSRACALMRRRIERDGYPGRWGRDTYWYLDFDGCKYWFCAEVLNRETDEQAAVRKSHEHLFKC